MRRFSLVLLLCAAMLPSLVKAGEVGGTLGRYSVAGTGVGALLGSVAATLPYLQSKEPYDFLTGAGIGMVAGCGIGFILGLVDLGHPAEKTAMSPPTGLSLAWTPVAMQAKYSLTF